MSGKPVLKGILIGALATVFVEGLVFFGLCEDLGVDSAEERAIATYVFEVPDSTARLLAREWTSFRRAGVDFVLQDGVDRWELGGMKTNETPYFSMGWYDLAWEDGGVSVSLGDGKWTGTYVFPPESAVEMEKRGGGTPDEDAADH